MPTRKPRKKTEGMRTGKGWILMKGENGYPFKGTLLYIAPRGGQRIAIFSVPKRGRMVKNKSSE